MVTGGAGFIGSYLAAELLSNGHDVTILDNLSTGSILNLPARAMFCEADMRNPREVDECLRDESEFDGVFHLASTVGVQRVMDAPMTCALNIVEAAWTLRNWCSIQPRKPRVLIASTSEVYGNGPCPQREDYDAILPAGPRWSYASAKLAVECGFQDAVIARIFNTIGPGQKSDYGMVVPRFMEAAISGNPLHVYSPKATRCFTSVMDTVAALIVLMNVYIPGVYNVGSEELITIQELAETTVKVAKSKSKIVQRNAPYDSFEEIKHRQPDNTKLMSLGWKPRMNLITTLKWTHQVLSESKPPVKA